MRTADTENLSEHLGASRKEEAQREGERNHPLADRLLGKHVIDQVGGCLHHPACSATRTEPSAFTRKSDKELMLACIALDAKKAPFEPSTVEVGLELVLDETRQ